MEIRKSGKIAIGIIAALGTIGALHVFIFKDTAAQYEAARNQYLTQLGNYRSQGKSPNVDEIRRFEYETARYQVKFWETGAAMEVNLPKGYSTDFREENAQLEMWDYLRGLEERRDRGAAGNGPTLSFLAETTSLGEPGWGLVTSLPSTYVQNRIAPEDDMALLRNEDRLLDSLDQTTAVYQSRLQNYSALLFKLGLNLNAREFLRERFGSVFTTIYTLNRIDQVMKNMPADFFVNMTEEQSRQLMYKLFRIEWPRDFNDNPNFLPAKRQLEILLQMVDAAGEAGIKDIPFVRLHNSLPIYWKDPAVATPTPAAAMGMMGGEFDESMFFMDAESMMGGGRMGFSGMQATPTPATAFDAVGAPVEIIVRGSNAAVMKWLYSLTHSPRPLELDRLRIVNISAQEGEILASAYFNLVTLTPAFGYVTEEEAQRNVVRAQRRLKEIANARPAVRELAVEDGLMVREGDGNYRWIGPDPTPWPGDPLTPTPAPVIMDPGMEF